MALIAVTRLRLRGGRFVIPFTWHTLRSYFQCRAAEGNLATVARRAEGAYWTLTVWRDKAAMRAFMSSGAHREAMPRLQHWCDEASLYQWEQESPVLPDWADAKHRLRTEGRLSAVKHPSPAHAAGATLGSSQTAIAETRRAS
jgi:hypothetical protein